MIVVDDKQQTTVITQGDHARLAGQLLALWRDEPLRAHPRRDALLLATREHDNGWRETDAAPRVDTATGRPHDFRSVPEADRLAVWERGIHRYAATEPLVALLVAEHAETVHQPLTEAWRRLFADLASHREQWLVQAAVDRDTVRQDYRYLFLADALSLALCTGDKRRLENLEIEARLSANRLELHPFPLAGTTTFDIPLRKVETRFWNSDREFAIALARSRWQSRPVKVAAIPDRQP